MAGNTLAEWKTEAIGLWQDIAPFPETITDHDQMVMARYTHGTLRKPYANGLAMIGNSAHRASPQLEQGANMALLDALALSHALALYPLEQALPAYAKARKWHVRIYQLMSGAFTPQYQSDSRILPIVRDRILCPMSRITPIQNIITRLVCGDAVPPYGALIPAGKLQ